MLEDRDPAHIAQTITEIVDAIVNSGTALVLRTVPLFSGPLDNYEEKNRSVLNLNERIVELASTHGIIVIDTLGTITPADTMDGVRPTALGHAKIRHSLAAPLAALLERLRS
jgi:hypothetical protein